jgi:hypothetical protein
MTLRVPAVAAVLCLLLGGVAYAATAKITPHRVGAVKLGAKHARLQARGLVGRLRAGCELAGPNTRVARLRAPLRGTVQLSTNAARRVTSIQVTGGAKARGVGIGDRIADIKAAFPKARVDHSTDETFAFTRVHVRKAGGGPVSFAVDTGTHRITLIGVPELAVCE